MYPLWIQLLHPPTRHRDLPSLEGPGVCLLLFFHTPRYFIPPTPFFIPPGFAVPLWERGWEGWRGWPLALVGEGCGVGLHGMSFPFEYNCCMSQPATATSPL